MAKLKITTRERVNVREDAGITFPVLGTINAWKTLTVEAVKQDVAGVNWYNIGEGWICSKFCDVGVTPAKTINPRDGEISNFVSTQPAGDNSIMTNLKNSVTTLAQGIGGGIGSALDSFLGNSVSENDAMAAYKRRIFASPYQFLPATDIRPKAGVANSLAVNLGRIFTANILSEAPILSIMPCSPRYLPSLSNEEKLQLTQAILDKVSESSTDLMKDAGDSIIDSFQTKYFGTDINHSEYIKYVNMLCRAAALFMGLGEQTVPGTTIKYKNYDWAFWRLSNSLNNSGQTMTNGDIYGVEPETSGEEGFLGRAKAQIDAITKQAEAALDTAADALKNATDGSFMDMISTEDYFVDFYVTPSTSYSESVSNRTEQSAFEGLVKKGSDMLKELIFVTGGDFLQSDAMRESVANAVKSGQEMLARISGAENGLFSRLLGHAETIISGSNIIFPEIWHDSTLSRSYRAEIKLVSPYGTNEAIYLNTLVPLFHLIAFAFPRQTGVNAYGAPFLVKAHINKWFNIEMGIIDSIEISKEDWNANGFPATVTVSVSFKDLYSAISISKVDSVKNAILLAMNQSLIEYMAVTCGLNMKRSEFETKIKTLETLVKNMPYDTVINLPRTVREQAANAAARVLGGLV